MKKMSLQWRLTIITTLLIAIICGCLTLLLYKNGIYYIDSLQDTVNSQNTNPDELYIDIPDDEWDDFAAKFSMKVYDSKEDYRKRSLLITVLIAIFGGAVTYFISGRALKPLRDFSKSVEKVCPKTFPFLLIIYTLHANTSLKSLHISSNTTGSAPPFCSILFNLLVLFNNDDN